MRYEPSASTETETVQENNDDTHPSGQSRHHRFGDRGTARFRQKKDGYRAEFYRGDIADADVERLRQAGYDDGEIVANVALNVFTNDFNKIAGTGLDFPPLPIVRKRNSV